MATRGRPRVDGEILDAALRLFYRDGIRATGVDRIISEADVAAMSVYRNFRSKEGVIKAALHHHHRNWMAWLKDAVDRDNPSPADKPMRLFDALAKWFQEPDFNGCMFINTAGEFSSPTSAPHQLAAEHLTALRTYVGELVTGAELPQWLGDALLLLFEGAIVSAALQRRPDAALVARDAASTLIAAAHLTRTPLDAAEDRLCGSEMPPA